MSYLSIIVFKLLDLVQTLLSLYVWVIIIAAVISWVNPDPYNPIVRFLRRATDPVLDRARRWLPFLVIGGLDLTPIAVIVALQIAIPLIANFAMQLSMGMR